MTAHAVVAIEDVMDAMEGPELAWALRRTPIWVLHQTYWAKVMEMCDLDDPEEATTEQFLAAINHYHERAGFPLLEVKDA